MEKVKKYFIIISALILVIFAGYYTKIYFDNKTTVKVYFVKYKKSSGIELVAVKRKIKPDNTRISTAITSLLNGPELEEKKMGYYTEIPENTKLNKIKQTKDKITIDLTRNFECGGGSSSLITRTNQLIRTATLAAGNIPVYLELDGKQIDVIGGEGILIEQPINKKEVK